MRKHLSLSLSMYIQCKTNLLNRVFQESLLKLVFYIAIFFFKVKVLAGGVFVIFFTMAL